MLRPPSHNLNARNEKISPFAALVLGLGVQFAAFATAIARTPLVKGVTDDVSPSSARTRRSSPGHLTLQPSNSKSRPMVLPYFDFAPHDPPRGGQRSQASAGDKGPSDPGLRPCWEDYSNALTLP